MLTSYECLKVLKFKSNIEIVGIKEVYWIKGSGVGTLMSIIYDLPKVIPLPFKCWESVYATLWSKLLGKSIFTAQYMCKNNLRQFFEESCLFTRPPQHKSEEQCECYFSLLLVKGMRTFCQQDNSVSWPSASQSVVLRAVLIQKLLMGLW